MSIAEAILSKSSELIVTNPRYATALQANSCTIVTVNDYGESKPRISDIPDAEDIIIISNALKMSEELFDFIKERINQSTQCEVKIIFTKINVSQTIIDEDDLYLLCDVLELINN